MTEYAQSMNLCDSCDTAKDCLAKQTCKPQYSQHAARGKHIVLEHNGRQRLIDLVIYFDGDKIVNITWDN